MTERITEVIETQKEHDERITKLEINEARITTKLEGLIEKIGSLTNWIKALVLLGISSLVGFFIWYIQNIGK